MKSSGSRRRRAKLAYASILVAITLILISVLITGHPQEELPSTEPAIAIGHVSAKNVPLYGLLEIDLNVTANFQNPFDPQEVNVTATVTTPSGSAIQLLPFYYQNFTRELANGTEILQPEGNPYWKVRFTPTEIGRHSINFTLRDRVGAVTSETVTFDVSPSVDAGFVGLSDADKRYFQFDNNRSAFFIGHDVCWFGPKGTYDYDEWFSAMKLNGENITRIWMAPWAFGIEWKQLGLYDMAEAWRLDYVLRKAEEEGIYVILCLMNHGQLQSAELTGQWDDNPYNSARGGPLGRPEDFWKDEVAMDLFRRRLRYITARWGYGTHILAWELWNEVELTDDYDFGDVAAWHDEMARYLRTMDPHMHLVTTSSDPRLGGLDSMSFLTVHRYGPDSFKDIAGEFPGIIKGLSAQYSKPVLITEFGADWRWFDDPYTYKDREGIEIHEGIWSSILSGSASSAMLWWWDGYVHPYNLYYHFKALSEFLKGLDPVRSGCEGLLTRTIFPETIGKDDLAAVTIHPTVGWVKPEANRFLVSLDGTVNNASHFCSFIQGDAHPELENDPIFVVNFPYGGDAIVHVNSVATSGAVLEIYVDDSLAERIPLPDRDGKNDANANEYNMSVTIPISPGTHEIGLDNSGGDWLSIDFLELTDVILRSAKTRVIGLSNGTLALVWIQNRDHTWWNAVNGIPVEPIRAATIELSGFVDGQYVVEWWDTYAGRITRLEEVVVSDGKVQIAIKDLAKDIALKIYFKR